jgi:PPOX class probable F420-dependent enzyme
MRTLLRDSSGRKDEPGPRVDVHIGPLRERDQMLRSEPRRRDRPVDLSHAKYLGFTTFRRDGSPVTTPVWFASERPDTALVWTGASTGKVRRIRSNPHVTVAPCDIRGRVKGPTVPGTARILGEDDLPRLVALLRRKYPLAKRGLEVWGGVSRLLLRRPPGKMLAVEITLG